MVDAIQWFTFDPFCRVSPPIVYRYGRRWLLCNKSLIHVTCDIVLQPRASCRSSSRVPWTSREPTTQRRTRRNPLAVQRWRNTAKNYWWSATISTSHPAATPIWPRATTALGRTYRNANQVKDVKRKNFAFFHLLLFFLSPSVVSRSSRTGSLQTPLSTVFVFFCSRVRPFVLLPFLGLALTQPRLSSLTRPKHHGLFLHRPFFTRLYLSVFHSFTSRNRTFSRFRHVRPRHSICPLIARPLCPLLPQSIRSFLIATAVIA